MKQLYRLNGTPPFISNTPLSIALTLLLFILQTASGNAQTPVNAYAKVTGYSATNKRLNITNRNQSNHTFTAGEQVIVMQMQDDVIGTNTNNDANFGKLGPIANAGFYEIATILSTTSTRINLTAALDHTFNYTTGNVQVISFTQLATNYTTSFNIPAVAWDPDLGTGGVVAFQVKGLLTLKHSITADGQGFTGGVQSDDYENTCRPTTYITSSTDYGAKGEGIYLNSNDNYSRGRGRLLTGGGGGNDDNAGGAGGGNYTAGGDGGAGWQCTATTASGGLGGISLNTYLMTGTRLFMGGGGGGGQGNDGFQTDGANGGGIIIIKADSLTTSCSSPIRISANGNSASGTTGGSSGGNDGAGGAGAGGTILMVVGKYKVPSSCALTIQANGGNGGNVNFSSAHGGGGGGGQGAILFSGALPSGNVTAITTPGQGGLNNTGGSQASNGSGSNNSGVIGGVGNPLPVQLISFSAENKNKKAILNWTTADESNITYNVQHSTDGVTFITIGTVKGTGNINTSTSYTYTDANVAAGKNFYRLELKDNATGRLDYSPVVLLTIADVQNVPVAYPNPAHDHFAIRVNSIGSKNFVVTVSDLTGHVIYSNTYQPANGIITVTPAQHLQPGLYMYKISGDGTDQTGKLIIQ